MGVWIDASWPEARSKTMLAASDGPGGAPPPVVLGVHSSEPGSSVIVVAGDERIRLEGGDTVLLALGSGVDVGVYHVTGPGTTVTATVVGPSASD